MLDFIKSFIKEKLNTDACLVQKVIENEECFETLCIVKYGGYLTIQNINIERCDLNKFIEKKHVKN